uniref:CG-1 domain-containing protein n=1 Tax=Macrostomum lignano TaxID=282301 RepID=A0A1I8IJF9_9PLAT
GRHKSRRHESGRLESRRPENRRLASKKRPEKKNKKSRKPDLTFPSDGSDRTIAIQSKRHFYLLPGDSLIQVDTERSRRCCATLPTEICDTRNCRIRWSRRGSLCAAKSQMQTSRVKREVTLRNMMDLTRDAWANAAMLQDLEETTATTTSTTGPLGRQHQSLRGPDRTAAALLAPIQFQSTRAAGGGQSYRGSRRYPARTNADSNGQYLGAVFPSIVNGDLGASNRPQVGAGGSITTRHHQHHPAAAAAGHDGVPALPSIRTRRGHRAAFAAPAPQPTAVAQASMADDAAIVASMLDSANDEKKSSGGPTVMSPNGLGNDS